MDIRNLLDKIGGRKFVAWLVCIALGTGMLVMDRVDSVVWKDLLIWITAIFVGGNTADSIAGKPKSPPTL